MVASMVDIREIDISSTHLWGFERIIENNKYCIKQLILNRPVKSSIHYHEHKTETFMLQSGEAWVAVFDNGKERVFKLEEGCKLTLEPFTKHQFWGNGIILEISTPDTGYDNVKIKPAGDSEGFNVTYKYTLED